MSPSWACGGAVWGGGAGGRVDGEGKEHNASLWRHSSSLSIFQLEKVEGDLSNKTIAVVLTGGNVSPDEIGFKERRIYDDEVEKKPMFVKTEKF